MKCEECENREAAYIWFDHNFDRLIPLCDECYHDLIHMFGEANIEAYDMNDPFFLESLLDAVNKRLKWHEDMQKILRRRRL